MATETPRPRSKLVVTRKQRLRHVLLGACFAACMVPAGKALSQEPEKKVAAAPASLQAPEKKVAGAPAFFEALDPIEVTLTGNIGKLRG
ncbi:MAG TPA: hypothetical protein VN927_04345, partial [Gemmatimonadaceae bacterium]|nr:hypothetical protein [Gemmatimonadaceae bacterium]